MTAFSIGRTPNGSYDTFAKEKRLDGVRIGVMREYTVQAAAPALEPL